MIVHAMLSNVGRLLAVLRLTGAAIGQGPPRVLLAVLAPMGFLLWVPLAIL
jgi:hypothetical protein